MNEPKAPTEREITREEFQQFADWLFNELAKDENLAKKPLGLLLRKYLYGV